MSSSAEDEELADNPTVVVKVVSIIYIFLFIIIKKREPIVLILW